jgi:hypothetical protein
MRGWGRQPVDPTNMWTFHQSYSKSLLLNVENGTCLVTAEKVSVRFSGVFFWEVVQGQEVEDVGALCEPLLPCSFKAPIFFLIENLLVQSVLDAPNVTRKQQPQCLQRRKHQLLLLPHKRMCQWQMHLLLRVCLSQRTI